MYKQRTRTDTATLRGKGTTIASINRGCSFIGDGNKGNCETVESTKKVLELYGNPTGSPSDNSWPHSSYSSSKQACALGGY